MFIGFKSEAPALNNLSLVPNGSLSRGAMSGCGPSRRFAASMKLGRFRTDADMNRQAKSATSVATGRGIGLTRANGLSLIRRRDTPNSSSWELPVASQIFVRERNSHASLTNGRCNALNGAQPNVVARKDTWGTCFKKVRVAAV